MDEIALRNTLAARADKVGDTHSWGVLIDASSSARRYQLSQLTKLKQLLPQSALSHVRLTVLTGPSLGAAGVVMDKMREVWPSAKIVDTKLACGGDRRLMKGTSVLEFAVTMLEVPESQRSSITVPHCILDMPARGGPKDKLSLRCNGSCGMADNADSGEDNQDGSDAVFKELMDQLADDGQGKHGASQRLWSFGRPINFYEKVFTQVLQAKSCGSLIVLSGTGSPNSMIAARDLCLPAVYVYWGSVKQHQRSHGECEFVRHLEEAALEALSAKRKRASLVNNMQYITATAPEHVTEVWDVPVVTDTDLAGVDAYEKVGSSIQKIRARELTAESFMLRPSVGGHGVFAQQRFGEGDTIMEASAVWLSDIHHVRAFLKLEAVPGQRFSDRIVKVGGLRKDGVQSVLFGILVGLAGEIQHCGDRRANAVLQVNPHEGIFG